MQHPRETKGRSRSAAALAVAVAVLALLALVLGSQNRELRTRVVDLRERSSVPYPGYAVPTFPAATLEGDTISVGRAAPGEAQLLFIYTATCEFCRASVPAWRAIAEHMEAGGSVSALGISLDSLGLTREFAERERLPFPVVMFPERKLQSLYRARAYPLIVLTDSAGTVRYSRLGVLAEGSPGVDSVLAAVGAIAPVEGEVSQRF